MINAFLGIWWLWIAAALVLGLIELFAPSFIFLGFALGALVTGLIVALAESLSAPAVLAIFACVSLLAWIGLKFAFRRHSSGARIITKDVNDN